MVEFQAASPERLNGIIRKFSFTYCKAGDTCTNDALRKYVVDRQHSRRRRASPTNNSTFQAELQGLEEYTTFSIQVSLITILEGPFSAVINASTDEGGKGQLISSNVCTSHSITFYNESELAKRLSGYKSAIVSLFFSGGWGWWCTLYSGLCSEAPPERSACRYWALAVHERVKKFVVFLFWKVAEITLN